MPSTLEIGFHDAMLKIYDDAKAACKGYRPTRFRQMVNGVGGVEAARSLLRPGPPSDGFTALLICKRIDLSMEALVLKQPWSHLFSDVELAEAKKRLDDVNYSGERGNRRGTK